MKGLRRLLESTIDATFMQRGFRASTHTNEILSALHHKGYVVIWIPPLYWWRKWRGIRRERLVEAAYELHRARDAAGGH